MKSLHLTVAVESLLLALLVTGPAWADVFSMPARQKSLEFVTVGDAGNGADSHGTVGRGAVAYTYQMGMYDVTAAQYCQFLNAVAGVSDPYDLYSPYMANPATLAPTSVGCGITRSGNAGSYTYSVTKDPDFPVNYVSWADAARFCNWLSNGQQGADTTETGSYALNGATTDAALIAITRNAGARYVIPSEDEWYKAAYYKGGGTDAGYWLYPTQNDRLPSHVLSSTRANNANYFGADRAGTTYTDPTNYLTAVGAFARSRSAYGTFDQGGDVWQWTEEVLSGSSRGLRGWSFYNHGTGLDSMYRSAYRPSNEISVIGFRVALVPEPATLALLTLGGLLIARRGRA